MKKKNIGSTQKILLIMLGGIGDMVLFSPSLKAIRQYFPGSKIILLTGEPGVEAVIEAEGWVDGVVLLDRKKGAGLQEGLSLIQRMRKEKFDLGIASAGTHAFKSSLMMFLMGIPERIGMNVNNKGFWLTKKIKYDPQENESEGSLRILEAIGIPAQERHPSLNLRQEDKDFVDVFLRGENIGQKDILIGMHAGSGPKMMDQKRWPKENFAQLADGVIRSMGAKVVFTGGVPEKELVKSIKGLMKEGSVSAVERLNLRQTAALIQSCSLFVANDSGIAHVAAAVKTPLIVMFGATQFDRIGPRGENVVVLKKEGGLGALSVEEVFECVKREIAMLPKGRLQ